MNVVNSNVQTISAMHGHLQRNGYSNDIIVNTMRRSHHFIVKMAMPERPLHESGITKGILKPAQRLENVEKSDWWIHPWSIPFTLHTIDFAFHLELFSFERDASSDNFQLPYAQIIWTFWMVFDGP